MIQTVDETNNPIKKRLQEKKEINFSLKAENRKVSISEQVQPARLVSLYFQPFQIPHAHHILPNLCDKQIS